MEQATQEHTSAIQADHAPAAIRVSVDRIAHKPLVILYAVLTARRAWMVAIVLAAAMVFVVQPALWGGVSRTFPPKQESKLFGLVKKEKPRAIARGVYGVFALTAWLGIAGVVVVRLRRHYPYGLAAAENLSGKWEREADTLRAAEPVRSRRLYRAALLFAVDAEREQRLKSCVESLGAVRDTATVVSRGGALGELARATDKRRTGAIGSEGRYILEKKLGEGAMGVVFLGHDRVLERTVALKQLSSRLIGDREYIERFTLEARALAKLSHPHIVQVYDLVMVEGAVWMVLEYVDGGTLSDRIRSRGRCTVSEAAGLGADVADGLAVVHAAGIIHRDIKPANILLTAEGRPKLSDFGIAKLACAAGLTQEGATLGSPAYMSPEQCNGEMLDERADIYSLGITVYELLTGWPPFAGDTGGILAQHLTGTPEALTRSVPDIPPALERVVMKMLAKRRENRQHSMGEVAEALGGFSRTEVPSRGI